MKNKKIIIISLCLFISLIASTSNNAFITNASELVPFLFTLLGLCLTAYTFIYNPLLDIINRTTISEESNNSLHKLLKSFEDDMIFIFYMTIFIIILNILENLDFPIIKDYFINLTTSKLYSIKRMGVNFFISFSALVSFYALYDLIQASFKVLKKVLISKI